MAGVVSLNYATPTREAATVPVAMVPCGRPRSRTCSPDRVRLGVGRGQPTIECTRQLEVWADRPRPGAHTTDRGSGRETCHPRCAERSSSTRVVPKHHLGRHPARAHLDHAADRLGRRCTRVRRGRRHLPDQRQHTRHHRPVTGDVSAAQELRGDCPECRDHRPARQAARQPHPRQTRHSAAWVDAAGLCHGAATRTTLVSEYLVSQYLCGSYR